MGESKEYTTRTRVLRILRALIERPFGYTVQQLANRYGVSVDTVRGDFQAMQNAGFAMEHDQKYRYRLIEGQPFRQLKDLLHFTEDDQVLLHEAIDQIAGHTERSRRLKKKLASLYDYRKLGHAYLHKTYLNKIDRLLEAQGKKLQIILRGYRSSNSNTVSDRRVEPFHTSPPDDVLHAFDVDQKVIRHYRISRITRVEITDQPWKFETRHVIMPTDPFRIVDSNQVRAFLRMQVGAYNELIERFPVAMGFVTESTEKDVYELRCMVNHRFYGLSNFILGQYHLGVEVLEPRALVDLLNTQVKMLKF